MNKLYSLKESANILGLSPYTLYNLTNRGKIKYIKVNNRKMFTEDIIKEFLECNQY